MTVICAEQQYWQMSPGEEQQMITQTAERLATRFPTVPLDQVHDIVHEAHVRFDHQTMRPAGMSPTGVGHREAS